jgi:hypothetical protein
MLRPASWYRHFLELFNAVCVHLQRAHHGIVGLTFLFACIVNCSRQGIHYQGLLKNCLLLATRVFAVRSVRHHGPCGAFGEQGLRRHVPRLLHPRYANP